MKINQIREEEPEEESEEADGDDPQTPEAIIAEIDPEDIDPGFLQEGKDFWAGFWSFVPVSPSKSHYDNDSPTIVLVNIPRHGHMGRFICGIDYFP